MENRQSDNDYKAEPDSTTNISLRGATDSKKQTNKAKDQQQKEKLKEDSPLLQYPPLPPAETSNAILQFVSSTSRFMNEFVYAANFHLEDTSVRINDMETQIMLLEAKLASDPGIRNFKDEKNEK